MKERLERLGRRWPWFGLVLRVQGRYSELNGNYLAAAITLAGFLSLFPLLLVAFAVLGFISAGHVNLASEVIDRLGLTGEAARFITSLLRQTEHSRKVTSVVSVIGLLWSGLGVVAAMQYTLDATWQVKGRGWKDKLSGLAWLAGAGVLFLASLGLATALNVLPAVLAPVNLVLSLGIDVLLWVWTMTVLTNRDLPWRAYLPGAVAGAVGFEILKVVGGIYVPRAVASASALYGSMGVIFALLAWLLFFGRLVVYAAVLNVVRWEEGHGTVTVELPVPKIPGEVPVEATRGGEVLPPVSATA